MELVEYLLRSGTGSPKDAKRMLRRLLPHVRASELAGEDLAELDQFMDDEAGWGGFGAWSRKDEPGAFRDDPTEVGMLRVGKLRKQTAAASKPLGRMRVNLVVNGGVQGYMDVMEGLVQRNVETIRAGKIPAFAASGVQHEESPIWRDALGAFVERKANAGTIAAWKAAERRVHQGDPTAKIALVEGVPAVVSGLGRGQGGYEVVSAVRPGTVVSGIVGATSDPNKGRIDSWLYVTLDDDNADAVRIMGDSIAKHNAKQIRKLGLPKLYNSGVVYKTEGSPEKWWDAEEILRHGHDDCEGLSAYRAGELMLEGLDAKVWTRLIPKPTTRGEGLPGQRATGRLFHAIVRVETPNGPEYDDPSARLGMPVPKWYRDYMTKQRAAGKPV